ncbi:hypothetical protein N8I77_004978 [Diaporthe amygdali]|uniref:Uncharacterized protein n=1 Tax=Phomopsis amygdali TaxID=1214568 RepID=A0AAD9W8C6_PHOAM|nr:hypothetical protein N8I77_004978 [Diaporthe amygdali]
MTTSPSLPADAPETVNPVAAVVEWAGQDGQPCYLSDSSSNPINLTIDLDRLSKTALLKLRIQLELRKPFSGKTSLCLCIPPERIHSAALDSSELSTESRRLQGHKLVCIRLDLAKAADLVAPDWPLRPNNKVHGGVLDSTQILAQQTSLSLHVPDTILPRAQLEWLCEALCRRDLHSADSPADGGGAYEGQNGRIIGPELFAPRDGAPAQGPPSYEELEPAPPPPPIVPPDHESDTASGSKKRKLSNSAAEGVEVGVIERICTKIFAEQLGQMENRMKEWVDRRLTEQEKKYEDKLDKLEEQIQDIEGHVDERVWLEVDDLRTGIQDDFDQLRNETEDFIREENRNAVDVIRKQLSESDVNIVGGRLEIT